MVSSRSFGMYLLFAFILSGLTSCAKDEAPGRFSIAFDWGEAGPPEAEAWPDGLWLWGRVEKRTGEDKTQWARLAESGLAPYDFTNGAALSLSAVPNGSDLVVVIEFVDESSKTALPVYFGESEPFTLEAGKDVVVSVSLRLTATPSGTSDATNGVVLVVDASGESLEYTKNKTVSLLLSPKDAQAVSISNDLAFSKPTTFNLSELQSKAEGKFLVERWNVNEGFSCESEQAGCPDGQRRVYVKFTNSQGYESEVFSDDVTLDTTPPLLANEEAVSPSIARRNQTVTVVLTPNEVLKDAPALTVEPAGPIFTLQETQGQNRVYSYTTDDQAEEGVTYRVVADLVDLAGNRTEGTVLGSFTVDATEPKLVGAASITPLRTGHATTLTAVFKVDEPLGVMPDVTLGKFSMTCTAEGRTYTCTYASPESGTDGEGVYTLRASLQDLAGNTSAWVLKDGEGNDLRMELDFSAPQAVSATAAPGLANRDADVVYQLTLDEPLAVTADGESKPLLTAHREVGTSLAFGEPEISADRRTLTWRHSVEDNEDGVYTVEVDRLCDDLGNCQESATEDAQGATLEGFEVDATLPEAPSLSVSWSGCVEDACRTFGKIAPYNAMTITVQFSEAPADRRLTIAGEEPSGGCVMGSSSTEWVCTHMVNANTDAEGTNLILVTVKDAAGNQASKDLSLVYDFTGPSILNATAAPGLANRDADVVYQLTLDEPLSPVADGESKPLLTAHREVGTSLAFGEPEISTDRRTLTWRHSVEDNEDGVYTVEVDRLCDDLGNCQESVTQDAQGAALEGFEVDATLPETPGLSASWSGCVEDACKTFGKIAPYNAMTITVQFSEAPTDRRLTIAGEEPSGGCVVGTSTTEWVCTHMVNANTDAEGTNLILVTVKDAAGNQASKDLSVYYDYTAPSVVSSQGSPDPAAFGATLTYQIATDENLDRTASRLNLLSDLDGWGEPTGQGRSFRWEKSVDRQMEAVYPVSIEKICDSWGNCHEQVDGTDIRLDSLAPDVTGLRVCRGADTSAACQTDETTFSAQSGYNGLVASFTLSQSAATLAVSVGTARLNVATDCQTGDGLRFVCRYGVQDDGQTPRVRNSSVSVLATDAAGNTDNDSLPVTFDFDPPRVLGTAYLERCDQRQQARVSPNELWVKSDIGAGGEPGAYGCLYGNAPQSGQVSVSFALSESVQSATRRVYADGGRDFVIDEAQSGEESNYIVAYYQDFSHADGSRAVLADLTDLAGNTVTRSVGLIHFDFEAPAVPDVNTEDKIVYARIPWGSDATGGVKQFTVRGEDNAVEADATVRIFGDDTGNSGSQLGSTAADANGAFAPLAVPAGDLPELYITQEDPAGNRSNPTLIRNVEWTATMGYKVPGSTEENPNILEARRFWENYLIQSGEEGVLEPAAGSGLETIGGTSVEVEGLPRWREIGSTTPDPRRGQAMVYDTARGVVVMFGGVVTDPTSSYPTVLKSETWEWDGYSWTLRTTSGPSPRFGHAMAYDSVNEKVIMFGGCGTISYSSENCDAQGLLDDTWEWDGIAAVWKKHEINDSNPLARYVHSMVYNSAERSVLMYGGKLAFTNAADTWEWKENTWHKQGTTGPTGQGGMVYDSQLQKVLWFGSGAWEWNGLTWSPVSTSSLPNLFSQPFSLYYNTLSQQVELIVAGHIGPVTKTYKWNGIQWDLYEENEHSYGQAYHSDNEICPILAIYDSHRQIPFMTGTYGIESDYPSLIAQHTWERNGKDWTTISPSFKSSNILYNPDIPTPVGPYDWRGYKNISYHAASNVTIFPKCSPVLDSTGQDMCGWNGRSWGGLTVSGGFNKPQSEITGNTYDINRGRTVMGSLWSETPVFEWDGTSFIGAGEFPFVNMYITEHEQIVYDGQHNKLLLSNHHGTNAQNENIMGIWSWDGEEMSLLFPYDNNNYTTSRCYTDWGHMYHSFSSGNTYIISFESDYPVCILEDIGWDVLHDDCCPDYVSMESLRGEVDTSRNRYAAYGKGWIDERERAILLEFNEGYSNNIPVSGPPARNSPLTTYHASAAKMFLFGGCSYHCSEWEHIFYDAWELTSGTARPGVVARFPTSALKALEATVKSLEIKAVSGGSGAYGQTYLYVPDRRTWTQARDACAAMGPGTRLATVTDADKLDTLKRNLGIPIKAWIGLSQQDGAYQWTDGTALDYTNWASNQPGSDACVAILPDATPEVNDTFKWDDLPCDETLPFLCELGPTEGSRLMLWDGLRWNKVSENSAEPANPTALEWSSNDTQGIQSMMIGSEQYINVAITPLYPNGWGGIDSNFGKVSLDYIEAVVRYRLPAEREVDCTNDEDDDADELVDCVDDECADDPACLADGDVDGDADGDEG